MHAIAHNHDQIGISIATLQHNSSQLKSIGTQHSTQNKSLSSLKSPKMVSMQYFDQNAPRSVASVQASAVNEVLDNQQQLQPQITIDGIFFMNQQFNFEIDSDLESVLTDSTHGSDSDDSSNCSVDFDSGNDSHLDYTLQLPKMPLTSRQKDACPLLDDSERKNGNDLDEQATIISYDSLDDARKRGLVGRPRDWNSTRPWKPPKRRQRNKKELTPKSGNDIDFESDEETLEWYNIPLK